MRREHFIYSLMYKAVVKPDRVRVPHIPTKSFKNGVPVKSEGTVSFFYELIEKLELKDLK